MDELQKLKLLILQNPKSVQLPKNEIDGPGFEDYSQLPVAPDRNFWWSHVRRAVGFVVFTVVDLHIRQARYFEGTNDRLFELEEAMNKLQERFPSTKEPVVEEKPVERIEAEGEPPTTFVPGASWDPFQD